MGRYAYLAVALLIHFGALADGVYFGGHGDTNSNWVGYEVKVTGSSMKWMAYTLDAEKRGKIKETPTTFQKAADDTWTAFFEEIVFKDNSFVYGAGQHKLKIVKKAEPQFIEVEDGKDSLQLRRVSSADARAIKNGNIPSWN